MFEIAGGIVLGGLILFFLAAFTEPLLKMAFWVGVGILGVAALGISGAFVYEAFSGMLNWGADPVADGCAALVPIGAFFTITSRFKKWHTARRKKAWAMEQDLVIAEAKQKALGKLQAQDASSPTLSPSPT